MLQFPPIQNIQSELTQLSELLSTSYRAHYPQLWADQGEAYIAHSFAPEQFTQEMAADHSSFFWVEWETKRIGMLKLNVGKAPDGSSAPQQMELERIYFLPEATGKGIGQKAMDFIFAYANEKGCRSIWLKTMQNSIALPFYQKCGFKIIGEEKLSFSAPLLVFDQMFVLEYSDL